MKQDLCELLLEAIDTMQQTVKTDVSALQNQFNSISITEQGPVLLIANPFNEILQQEKIQFYENSGISIQPGEVSNVSSWQLSDQGKYDRLGIEFLVTTSAIDNMVPMGDYGATVVVYGSNKIYTAEFSFADMLGDVYNFNNMLQKQIFDITDVKNILFIALQFYNRSNIPVIFKNVSLCVGYDLNSYGPNSEPLILYGETDNQEYITNVEGVVVENTEQILCARFIYNENGVYKAITHNNPDLPAGISVRWYRYSASTAQGDQYGGAYWSYMPFTETEQQAGYNIMRRMVTNFNPTEEFEQFKIVVLKSNFADNSIASYTSNIITLANHKQALENLLTETGIVFEDGTDGIYPLYAFDQKIIPDQLFQTLIKRHLSLKYKTTLTERELYSHLVKVTWKLPADHMFFAFDEMAEKNILADNYMSCYMVDEFHPLNDEVADEDIAIWLKDLFTIPYTIANERVANIDNMVICEIELDDGITYLFEKDVSFTTQGSGGTDNSVLVRLIDGLGRDQSAITPGVELFLQPRIFNVDGEDITNKTTISVEFKVNTGAQNELTLGVYDNELGVIPISAANDKIDNILAIVKITFTFIENNLQLEELVPITIASSNNIVYRGPVAVMYNSAGNSPEYNHNNLTLYKDTILVEPLWSSLYVDSTYIKNYPKLNGSAFIPKNTFDKSMEIGYGIKATWNNGTDYFIQPIPIYQNKYFARIINEWDGALEINEEGNYILASSYVAGGKNDANQFTGVILGETGTITETDITDKETGVFGYKEGVQTFGVRSDGTAFMGRSGDGRILIDGEDGIIYSGNFDGFKTVIDENGKENIDYKQLNETSTQGTYLNLKDGTFITNEGLFRGALRSEDLQVGNGEDVNIVFNNDKEYIQSDKYELNEDGSAKSGLRIDLREGSIHSPYFSTNNNGAMYKGQLVVEGGYWYEDKDGNIIEAPYKIENYYLKNSDPYTVPSQNDASWNVNEPIIESGEYIWQKNVKKYYGKNDEVVIFRITGIDGIVGGDGPAGESAYSIDVQEDFAAIFLTNNEWNVAVPDIPLRVLYGSEPVAITRTNIYAEEDFNINALAQNAYALRVTLNNLVFPAQTTSNTDELRANLTINNSTKVITISNIVLPANNANGTINFAYGKRVGDLFSIVASGLFEVITYVNGKDGNDGNAIVDIIEYYKATDTQIAPDIDDSWETSIEKAGQSKTRPFLWNYEKTLYSHTEETITDVCLLSSTPRVIETITEYYAIVNGLAASAPAAPTLSADGNSIVQDSLVDWDTNSNLTPQEGQALWNCEIIKYGAVDAEGKNLYQVTPPARIGYVGQNGTDGKGVAIKGTAYVPKGTIIQQNQVYTIYIDEACETVLTAVEDGDAYLVTDQLFVYAGYNNENDEPQFLCVGTIQGPAGKDGVGINIINNYYMASSRKTGVIAGSEGEREGEEWVLGIIPELSEEKPYLWNYEVTAYVGDKEQDITSPAIIGYWNDGISIKEIKEYYCITPSTFAPEFVLEEVEDILPEDGAVKNVWYSVNIVPTSTNRYLWNYERVIYSGAKEPDGFGPSNIGVYGKQGIQGKQGLPGLSPYSIELTNDNVTITTDSIGMIDNLELLRNATETNVYAWSGDENITESCSYSWSISGDGALAFLTGAYNYLTEFIDDEVIVTVVVSLSESGKVIGTKSQTISKSKTGQQGDAAVVYELRATPSSVNMSNRTDNTHLVFTVTKITGADRTILTGGYLIKYADANEIINNIYYIPETFNGSNFELYVNEIKVDEEYVSAVWDGEDGTGVNVKENADACNEIGDAYINQETGSLMILTSISDDGKVFTDGGQIKGDKGADGNTTYFHTKYSNDGGQTFTDNNGEDEGRWLGTYTDFVKADSSSPNDYKWVKIAGADGDSIVAVINYYMISKRDGSLETGSPPIDGNINTTYDESNWVQEIKVPNAEYPYLWNYEEIEYSTGSPQKTDPVIIGKYSADGVGISKIEEIYCSTNKDTILEQVTNENFDKAIEEIDPLWQITSPITTPDFPRIWNAERITYTDGNTKILGPALIGSHGEQGNDAVLYKALADAETIKRVQQIDEAGNISYRYILPNGAINVVMQRIEGQNGPIIDTTNFQWAFGNVLIESRASFSLTAEKLEQLPQDPEITYVTLVISKEINNKIIELDKILFNFIEDGSPGSDAEETVVVTYQLYCTTDGDEINKIYAPDKYPPLPTTKFDGSDYNDGEVYWIGGTTSPIEINPNGNFNANGEDIWIWTSTYQYVYKKSTPNDGEYSYTTPTLLNSNTQVTQWCIKNGKTVINDSEIYTGGVIADSLTGRVLKSLNWYEGTVSGHGDVNQQGGIYTLDYSYSFPGINYNHVECKIILNPRKYYENGQLIDIIGTVERECTFTGTNVNTISQNDYYWYKIEDVNNSYYYFYQDSTFSEKISDEYLYYNNNTMYYANGKYGLLPAPLARDSNLHIIEGSQYDLNNGTMTTPGFTLDKYGNATFSGTVNAYQGKMAGWDIQRDGLYHNKNSTTADIYLGTDGIKVNDKLWTFKVGNNFRVSLQGDLYVSSGQLGRWNIGNDGIYYVGLGTRNNPDVYLGAGLQLEKFFGIEDTKWTLKAGDKFGVTQDGTLYAANANILAGSTIAGWTTSENIFGKLSPRGGNGLYYGISLNANNIGTKDAPVLAVGLMSALDNINNNALFFMVDGHGYAKAKHLIAETGQIGEWIIADSGPLQYNSTQSLLSIYAQTNNSAYLGKEEIHIAIPPQAVTDTDSYQYYTVLKPGAIINTMDPYGSHTGDIATILEARELKFLDLRGLTNKRLKNYDLATLPDDININAGNGIYGYIGLPSNATGSNRASRGLIENFDIHAGAGGTASTIGTNSEPFSTIYTQKLYLEGYEISWTTYNGRPYINFQGAAGIMVDGIPI